VFGEVERLREIALDVPAVVSLAHRLRARGYPIPDAVLDEPGLVEALRPLVARRAEASVA
jgi:hypothetical protein